MSIDQSNPRKASFHCGWGGVLLKQVEVDLSRLQKPESKAAIDMKKGRDEKAASERGTVETHWLFFTWYSVSFQPNLLLFLSEGKFVEVFWSSLTVALVCLSHLLCKCA